MLKMVQNCLRKLGKNIPRDKVIMNLNEGAPQQNVSKVQLRKCWKSREGQQKQEEEHDGGMMRRWRKLKQSMFSGLVDWNSVEENSSQNTVRMEVNEAKRAGNEVMCEAYES